MAYIFRLPEMGEGLTEGDVASYEDGAVYFVLSPETGKLSKIVVNNVVVYEVE